MRRPGEGSIYRRKDGRIAIELRSGGRKFGPVYARDDQEAIDKLAELRRQAGVLTPSDAQHQTLGDYLRWWVAVELPGRVAEGTLAATTAVSYTGNVERWLIPQLGHVKLRRLGVQHVKELMRTLATSKGARGQPLSARTRQYIHAVLRTALSDARQMELVERNVAELVTPPSVVRARPPVLSPTAARRVLKVIVGDRLEALWVVAMTLGLRPGEALGLCWDAIDLEARSLEVRTNLVRVAGQWRLNDTKAHRSRTVTLPAFAVGSLRARKSVARREQLQAGPQWVGAEVYDRAGGGRIDADLVFTDALGRPLRRDWVEDELARICKKAGLPRMTPHKFMRHGGATLMLAQGADVYTVKDILGHSSVKVTEGYVQVLEEAKSAAADAMDAMFGAGS